MKRELKLSEDFAGLYDENEIAEPIPMKRELKHRGAWTLYGPALLNCRAYPDEKGIETIPQIKDYLATSIIAEPIPMKRELKQIVCFCCTYQHHCIAEPIPMKRELKPFLGARRLDSSCSYCRAYPDEKGIETTVQLHRATGVLKIAEPIPMKRELKLCGSSAWPRKSWASIAEPIPMKRELKRLLGVLGAHYKTLLQSLSR